MESFLKTPFALKQATAKSKSPTVKNLHLVEIREIKLPVPPLSVQDEWIDFLEKQRGLLNREEEALRQMTDLLGALSQSGFSGEAMDSE